MKIIDSKKDYYDYLAGVVGIDNKVVFDRRGSVPSSDVIERHPAFFSENELDEAGNNIVRYDNKSNTAYMYITVEAGDKKWFIKVERTHIANTDKATIKYSFYDPLNMLKPTWAVGKWWEERREKEIKKLKERISDSIINIQFDYSTYYPRKIREHIFVEQNTLLGGFPFKGMIPAESVWDACYDYIMKHSVPDIQDNRTNDEHIISAGFDKKTSFRNM